MKNMLLIFSIVGALALNAADTNLVRVSSLAPVAGEGQSTGWLRPNDWAVSVTVVTEPVSLSEVVLVTNAVTGTIISNMTGTTYWSLSADLGVESLDETATEFKPGVVTFEPLNGGVVTNGTRFIAPEPGLYRVQATSSTLGVRYGDIPLTQRQSVVSNEACYVADATDIGWRAAVNDAFLADLKASTLAGSAAANGEDYDLWWTLRCPARPISGHTVQGYRSRNALSPHLLLGARHYGYNGNASYLTFHDPVGGTNVAANSGGLATGSSAYDFVAIPNGWGFSLCMWALTNGWTRAELADMHIEDIAVYPIIGGTLPDACCPYIMSIQAWKNHFGGRGTLGGWAFSQTYVGRTAPDGMLAGNYMTPCILRLGDMAFDGYGACSWTCAAYAWPKDTVRLDIHAQRAAMEAQGAAHAFPPIYGGDSSGGIYIQHEGRWIMASFFTSIGGGPSISAALPVLKKLCEAYGDTLKTIEE